MKKTKTYVLDTNVLMSDPDAIYAFEENDLIIPMAVLEEMDRHKSRGDDAGKNARQVNRQLDELRLAAASSGSNLVSGIKLRTGGILKIASFNEPIADSLERLPPELRVDKVDNQIVAYMLMLKNSGIDAILVSRDINVRVKCDCVNVKCEDYRKIKIVTDTQKFYRGVNVIVVEDDAIGQFYEQGTLAIEKDQLKGHHLYPNQVVVIKSIKNGETNRSAITKYVQQKSALVAIKETRAFGLKPRNKEQTFSLDLLFDESVKLLTLAGPAGTGKTLLALAAGLQQLKQLSDDTTTARYDRVIITRPVQPIGKELGFLPGTLQEKMDPWIAPIKDNLNHLLSMKNGGRARSRKQHAGVNKDGYKMPADSYELLLLQERGLIEIEAITYIRGRSIPNAFILIDEAQNLTPHELKTIITRAGEGSKIVLTGDIEQIDNSDVDAYTNGLSYAVERFKDQQLAGHVTLEKGERSPLATLASKIL